MKWVGGGSWGSIYILKELQLILRLDKGRVVPFVAVFLFAWRIFFIVIPFLRAGCGREVTEVEYRGRLGVILLFFVAVIDSLTSV